MNSSERDRDPGSDGGDRPIIPGPCVEFGDRVEELLEGVLSPEEAERLHAHSSVCSSCAREERAAGEFRNLLRDDGREALDQVVSRALTEHAVRTARWQDDEAERRTAAAATPATTSPSTTTPAASATKLPTTTLPTTTLPTTKPSPTKPLADTPADRPRLALVVGSSGRVFGTRAVFGMAAAATLMIAVAASSFWMVKPHGPPELAAGRPTLLPPGSIATISDGRALRTTSDATLLLREDSVLLGSGAATFWSDADAKLGVETPLGWIEGTGAMFHVALDDRGGLSVQVTSGDLTFRGSDGAERPDLTAGERLEIDASGGSRIINGVRLVEAELAAHLAGLEAAGLKHDAARLQEEIAELRIDRGLRGPAPVSPTVSTEAMDQIPWDEMGAAAAALLQNMQRDGDVAARHNAAGVFMRQLDNIKQAIGVSNPFDGLLHPGAISRLAPGFVNALAPDADAADRARAIDRIQAAAEVAGDRLRAGQVPADVIVERLDLWREVVVIIRDCLGDGAAAEVAGGFCGVRDITAIRPEPIETYVEDEVAVLGKEFDLTADQRDQVKVLIEDYVEATVEIQGRIEAEYGEAVARRYLVRPPPSSYDAADDSDVAGDVVDQALLEMEVKRAMAGPRAALERQAFDVLRADQRARGFKRGWGLKSFVDQRKRRNRDRADED